MPLPESYNRYNPQTQYESYSTPYWLPPETRANRTTTIPAPAPAPTGGTSGMTDAAKRAAARNLGTVANYNATTARWQNDMARRNFDLADQQNRRLADVQFDQNSQKAAGERFAQNKKLQQTARSVIGAAGNGLQGSGTLNLIDMLRNRTDLDSGEVLGILAQNQNAVRNALDESLNANVLSRNEAAATTEAQLRGIEADTAAQLNNIDPDLFVAPGTGAAKQNSANYEKNNRTAANVATRGGYIMPAASTARPATRTGTSYYDRLLNSYGRR